MMAHDSTINTYEEARKQRLLDNKKRFEDLGILKLSKSLTDLTKSEKRSQQRQVKPKLSSVSLLEPRRSSRARNPVPSYRDDVDIELPLLRRRSKLNSSWASYLARPLEEVKTASYEERVHAIKCAEKVQSNLQSEHPCFVKSMVRSHVYSCFWLGLPTRFCEDHLPKSTENIVLEDENGTEYEAIFISKRTGLSGGWRGFALDHKLDDGDALVFELVEPTRFKIYIVKASNCSYQDVDEDGDFTNIQLEEATKPNKRIGNETKLKKKMKSTQNSGTKRRSGSPLDVDEDDLDSKKIPTESKRMNRNKKSGIEANSKDIGKPTRVSARTRSKQ